MAEALIALGGNIGDVRATFDRAVDLLCEDGTVRLLARSSDYRTPPWGVEDQPPFINACLMVDTDLTAHALLNRTRLIERTLGRDRANEQRWGPRTIDIDLIAHDDAVIDHPDLQLPHPRARERAFVLVPLNEIAPERSIGGISVREALARVDAGGIERLPGRAHG
jgi:2-amino-4-hydroxy-6-hydroxymethyldihydropteridine diphosphokinase